MDAATWIRVGIEAGLILVAVVGAFHWLKTQILLIQKDIKRLESNGISHIDDKLSSCQILCRRTLERLTDKIEEQGEEIGEIREKIAEMHGRK